VNSVGSTVIVFMLPQDEKHEVPPPQRYRTTRYVSWNLVNCCTAVQKSHLERLAV